MVSTAATSTSSANPVNPLLAAYWYNVAAMAAANGQVRLSNQSISLFINQSFIQPVNQRPLADAARLYPVQPPDFVSNLCQATGQPPIPPGPPAHPRLRPTPRV